MLKKDITYENFDGESVTETFHFHISKTELLEMEVSMEGGFEQYMQKVVQSQDGKAIMGIMQNFILKSVGKKSPDGSRFIKNQEVQDDFRYSPAYDALFMELCTNPDQAAEFLNGIVPKGLQQDVEKLQNLEGGNARLAVEPVSDPATGGNVFDNVDTSDNPAGVPRILTRAEAAAMDREELGHGLATGKYELGQD